MIKFTWAEYYDSFYEWSPGTQKNYSYGLENYGSAEEVLEIASEFSFDDEKFAARFVDKAMNAGVRFTAEQVMEMVLYIEKPVLSRAAELACTAFTAEDMENLYVLIDDASFERISKKLNIDIFAEDTEDADDTDEIYDEEEECCEYVPPKKRGKASGLDENRVRGQRRENA